MAWYEIRLPDGRTIRLQIRRQSAKATTSALAELLNAVARRLAKERERNSRTKSRARRRRRIEPPDIVKSSRSRPPRRCP
jgi:hypothetical protein